MDFNQIFLWCDQLGFSIKLEKRASIWMGLAELKILTISNPNNCKYIRLTEPSFNALFERFDYGKETIIAQLLSPNIKSLTI